MTNLTIAEELAMLDAVVLTDADCTDEFGVLLTGPALVMYLYKKHKWGLDNTRRVLKNNGRA